MGRLVETAVVTHVTSHRMGPDMYGECVRATKSLFTQLTLVRFLSSVGPHMCAEIASETEPFLTHVTLEWLFSSVTSHMSG